MRFDSELYLIFTGEELDGRSYKVISQLVPWMARQYDAYWMFGVTRTWIIFLLI